MRNSLAFDPEKEKQRKDLLKKKKVIKNKGNIQIHITQLGSVQLTGKEVFVRLNDTRISFL